MKTAFARVVENEHLYGDIYLTWFDAPEIVAGASPGQFVMLRCAVPAVVGEAAVAATELQDDPLLPRAMSVHRVRNGAKGLEWSILYDIVGRGTAWLASRRPGDLVFCWGPLGHDYEVRRTSQQLLLVAGGIGVAPLIWLADDAIEQGKSVALVLGGRTAAQIFPTSLLPAEVEVVVTTEDGSAGSRGLATDAFVEHFEWCDQAFACGPNTMFESMAGALRRSGLRRPAQVLLEEDMACGTGICYACAVQTRRGMRLVCKDGPKFELLQVY